MVLKTSTTGSFPPIFDSDVGISHLPIGEQNRLIRDSIERAINDQIEIGIDILVDGQVRDDIVSVICKALPGYDGVVLPYKVVGKVRPSDEPITLSDYLIARSFAGDRPLKAHITGPITIARGSFVDPKAPYRNREDPQLVKDIAFALGHEAKVLVEAGAEVIQIDEPALKDGVDLDLAYDAIKTIIEIGEIPFPAMHICGNISRILKDVLSRSPVRMVSIEGSCLLEPEARDIDYNYLSACNKQIGLGCISTNSWEIEKTTRIQWFLDDMVNRLGADGIWAVMTDCGLRTLPHDIARAKLQAMVEAVRTLPT